MTIRRLTIVLGMASLAAASLAAAGLPSGQLDAQEAVPPPLRYYTLSELHRLAELRDPRTRQAALYRAQSALREQTIRNDRRPAPTADGVAQYQSDVPSLPVALPGGAALPRPAHDTYDARLGARQRLFDPTIRPRIAVERAQLAESEMRVETSVYQIREAVNEAYYASVLLHAERHEHLTAITDLEAKLRLASERVAAGTALRSEASVLEAEVLRRRQLDAELVASRAAALEVLRELTGVPYTPHQYFSSPDLSWRVEAARPVIDTLRARPEYAQFRRARNALAAQEGLVRARALPRVSAFGRAGYGRPGLNVLGDRFDSYWIAGVQVEWTPWTWGAGRREREVLALQREIVNAEEEAFHDSLRRTVIRELSTIAHLEKLTADDHQIITLREQILAETELRYRENVVSAAEYVDRQTDLLHARLLRNRHHDELSRAQARLLLTLGLEAH